MNADLVITNCSFLGEVESTRKALAVIRDRIVFVGKIDDIKDWIGTNTRIINAQSNSMLPGFIDSHVHFSSGGSGLSGVQLRDAATPDEFIKRISDYASHVPRGEWITGGRWDHERWASSPLPHKKWIDDTTSDNPVLVSRYDGHMCLANSFALRLAGISRETISPPGGLIEKDAEGEPTGILKDEAIYSVQKVIPEPTGDQLTRGIKAALSEARRLGVTGIHDNASPAEFAIYQKLLERGELTCRVYCLTPVRFLKSMMEMGIKAPFGNEWLRIGAIKAFADGSLGSSTALFFTPYDDDPQNSGLQMGSEENMFEVITNVDIAGLQVCVHAIGDKANAMVLDLYERAFKVSGGTPDKRRFRIEHAQHLRNIDIQRFASLGIIASMQPYHLYDDGSWAEKRIGRERCKTTYAFKSILDGGVHLAFGSDWPVVPLDPLLGIREAITRQTSDGKNQGGWFPEQKITLGQAIRAYTLGSAYAEFAENDKGSLEVGKLADIVILNEDLRNVPSESINKARVMYTIVGGRVVYEVGR